MEVKVHHFSSETRKVAVELWLKKIRDQLQMSKAELMRLLAHARNILTSLSSFRR
jgi:hypothetical protein